MLGSGSTPPTAAVSRVSRVSQLVFVIHPWLIRSVDYMTGFKCNVTGSTSNVPLATPKVPRRCGADPANHVANPAPGNCTYGAKNPFYWFQKERNNVRPSIITPTLC